MTNLQLLVVLKNANSDQPLAQGAIARNIPAVAVADAEVGRIVDGFQVRGYYSRLEAEALKARLMAYGSSDNAAQRTRLAVALDHQLDGWVDEFVRERAALFDEESNCTCEARARTGKGKTTALLGIMERVFGLTPEEVPNCVFLHKPPFIRGVTQLNLREHGPRCALLDEDDVGSGQGARTDEATLERFEGRLRAAGTSMFFCKPNYVGDFKRDLTLECIGNSSQEKAVLAIVYVGEEPVGYELLPWCSLATYEAYRPVKAQGLEVVTRGISPHLAVVNSTLLDCIRDTASMERMALAAWRPAAIKRELRRSPAGQWASSMVDELARELADIGPKWEDRLDDAEEYLAEIAAIEESGVAW